MTYHYKLSDVANRDAIVYFNQSPTYELSLSIFVQKNGCLGIHSLVESVRRTEQDIWISGPYNGYAYTCKYNDMVAEVGFIPALFAYMHKFLPGYVDLIEIERMVVWLNNQLSPLLNISA